MDGNRSNSRLNDFIICPANFKAADDDEGVVVGLASTFDLDLGDDQIHPGAFKKTVRERVPAGRVKFLDSHRWTGAGTLGTVVAAKETDAGLEFRARLSKAPSVEDIRIKMLEGHLNFTSIGFQPLRADWEERTANGNRKMIRHIREVKLFEISAVPIPMNEGARISMVKSALRAPSLDEALLLAAEGRVDVEELKEGIRLLAVHVPADVLADLFKSLTPQQEPSQTDDPAEPGNDPLTADDAKAVRDLMAEFRTLELELQAQEVGLK